MAFRTEDYLQSIVRELTKLPFETEGAEFKCNTKDPERTAKYISGLSNSAKLCDKPFAYLAYINFSAISNSDVRRTFGLEDNKVKASRIIKDTLKANRIKLVDEKASDKNKRYVPIWA